MVNNCGLLLIFVFGMINTIVGVNYIIEHIRVNKEKYSDVPTKKDFWLEVRTLRGDNTHLHWTGNDNAHFLWDIKPWYKRIFSNLKYECVCVALKIDTNDFHYAYRPNKNMEPFGWRQGNASYFDSFKSLNYEVWAEVLKERYGA